VKTYLLVLFILLYACETSTSSSKEDTFENDKAEILKVLDQQQKAWNNYDLEGFMNGYWKSDDLKFYGGNGLTHGWEQTLANYHNRYPSIDNTGNLKFTIDAVSKIENALYYVMGQYHLKRTVGDANGTFMIIFKKIDGEWKIIADSSC
jgi:ketosteroid isomerase-like protein